MSILMINEKKSFFVLFIKAKASFTYVFYKLYQIWANLVKKPSAIFLIKALCHLRYFSKKLTQASFTRGSWNQLCTKQTPSDTVDAWSCALPLINSERLSSILWHLFFIALVVNSKERNPSLAQTLAAHDAWLSSHPAKHISLLYVVSIQALPAFV